MSVARTLVDSCVPARLCRRRLPVATLPFLSALLALAVLLWPPLPACGQAFVNGTISGTVTDSSGAVIPAVSLTLTNTGTSAKITTESDAAGLYQFPNLAPGHYRLDAEKSGFTHFTREPIQILVNSSVHIDITMQVGAVSQTVEVRAETPLLQPESSSLGQVIETRSVNELPLNGRNPLALVSLAPGVVPQGSSGTNPVTQNPFAQGNIQINGGAANMSAAYWDGAPMNSSGYVNLLVMVPSQDALQEFKVQTDNLPAQYDRFAGGIISFSTKSGTNQVHGEAYEYLRNKVLNANNFFNNRAGIPTGAFTQNQFGGTFGGPLVLPHLYNGKDKTFFFTSFDGFRLREGLPLTFSVPTMAMRAGDFSGLVDANGNQIPIYDPTTTCGVAGNPPCQVDSQGNPIYTRKQFPGNIIPPDRLDSASKVLSNLWGKPNTPGTQNGLVNNWAGNASEGGDMNEFTIRVDQNVSEKQRLFGRYTINKYNNLAIDPFGTHAYPLQIGTPENTKTQQMVFDDSYSISPTKILDIELAYLRNHYTRTPQSSGYDLGQLGPGWAPLNNQVSFRTLPNLVVQGVTDFSSQETGSTIADATDDWDLLPNFTMIKGRNTIKIGGDFRLSRFNYAQVNSPSGIFTFDRGFTQQGPAQAVGGFGFASFMLGTPSSANISSVNFVATQQIYRAWYVMDDIRATRKLTINLGLRYSQDGPFSERFNRISTFIANAPNPLISKTVLPENGTVALVNTSLRPGRNGFNMDPNQWGPRIGLAYQLTPETVLRGGYGLFWLPNSIAWFGTNPAVDPINLYSSPMTTSLNGGLTPANYMANPFPNGINPAPGRDPVYASELIGQNLWNTQLPNQPYAYVQQWNADLQKTLPGGLFLDIAYAGSKGTHLPQISIPISQLPDSLLSLGNALLTQVPNPYFGIITQGGLSGPTVQFGQLLRPFPQYNGVQPELWQGNSIYHAMQLKVQKRFSNGQTILVSYTISKYLTDAESISGWLEAAGAGGFQDFYNMKAERSLSSYDVPQRLVVSYVLDLPVGYGKKFLSGVSGPVNKLVSGWGMQGVTTLQRGFPIFIGDSSNTTNSFGGGQRPNYDPNPQGCASGPALSGSAVNRLNEWFNTACFSHPPAFTFGNLPRVMPNIRWDGLVNFDWALVKNTTFGPENKLNLQFRAEFFNLFNHPQFGPPGNTFGTPNFGIVSSQYNNPRLVQFGLKLMF
jgi:hypothetical protein